LYQDQLFQDRLDAGRQLAERLISYRNEKPLILAIPRGGVPVGYEIARALAAPLDVIVVRKLGAPGNPEFGVGAIGPGGIRVLDQEAIAYLHISAAELERTIAAEQAEMERRIRRFRGDRPLPEVRGRTVIVVDDGLATGVTAAHSGRAGGRAGNGGGVAAGGGRVDLSGDPCQSVGDRALVPGFRADLG